MNKILKGQMFIVDEFELENGTELEKEFDKIEYYEEYNLSKGILTTVPDAQALRFDIDLGKEIHGTHFQGILHPNHTFAGNIQFTSDTHTSHSILTGHYKLTTKSAIILAAIWEYPDGIKEYCWIELK